MKAFVVAAISRSRRKELCPGRSGPYPDDAVGTLQSGEGIPSGGEKPPRWVHPWKTHSRMRSKTDLA